MTRWMPCVRCWRTGGEGSFAGLNLCCLGLHAHPTSSYQSECLQQHGSAFVPAHKKGNAVAIGRVTCQSSSPIQPGNAVAIGRVTCQSSSPIQPGKAVAKGCVTCQSSCKAKKQDKIARAEHVAVHPAEQSAASV